jgi:hypothetical protein
VLKKVADDLKDDVRLEKPPSMEGRSLYMILIPNSTPRPEKVEDKDKMEDLADAKA